MERFASLTSLHKGLRRKIHLEGGVPSRRRAAAMRRREHDQIQSRLQRDWRRENGSLLKLSRESRELCRSHPLEKRLCHTAKAALGVPSLLMRAMESSSSRADSQGQPRK